MSGVRICDRCGAKIDPGLFGKMGRSTYHLVKMEDSEALAECAFCKDSKKLPLYEMKKPIFRPYSPRRGGGERFKAGREYDV